MAIKKGEVFIFKASTDEDSVTYVKLMEESNLLPKIVPVLDFEYCNLKTLKNFLDKPEDFSGIVFTSPRAVHAVSKCVDPVKTLHEGWNKLPMFVVGGSSKQTLFNQLGLIGQCGETENAAGLAELILKNSYERPLLFPCSDMRRETLPSLLSQKGITLEEITVYCTKPHPELNETLRKLTSQGTVFPEFMVFFSPSGIKYAVPILSQLNAPFVNIKVVAIGSTTQSALKEANITVWSCSSRPNPNDLLRALVEKMTHACMLPLNSEVKRLINMVNVTVICGLDV